MAATVIRGTWEPQLSRLDGLLVALDDQRIGEGPGSWRVEVLGVHESGGDLWVQIARNGAVNDTLVLHLLPWATARDALIALATAKPGLALPHVLDAPPSH
jgi:hypothetical protein